jgi:hypothetical protein
MNRSLSMRAICLGVSVLFLAATSAMAADEKPDEETGGGVAAKAEDMPAICKDQAAKLKLSGADADSYLEKCTETFDEGARAGAERLEGSL